MGKEVRELRDITPRVETGAVAFGEDSRGLFVCGDGLA